VNNAGIRRDNLMLWMEQDEMEPGVGYQPERFLERHPTLA